MALSEFELKKIEKAVTRYIDKNRPPPHIRHQVDLGYRISGQSVEIFEIRPFWINPQETVEGAIAKATYVKGQRIWKVYWQRADLKWHRYEPSPEVKTIEAFFELLEKDAYGCFFG